jgi:hypothetical protein
MTTDEDKIARLFGAFGDIFDDQADALKLASRIAGGEKGVRESSGGLKPTLEDCLARASRDGIRLGLVSRDIESVMRARGCRRKLSGRRLVVCGRRAPRADARVSGPDQ